MANDFSGDAKCIALWRFEDGALIADSKGGNTLTVVNTPAADLANFKEGAASSLQLTVDNDAYSIADAALDPGFPGKAGDGGDKWSICFWLRMHGDWAGAGFQLHYVFWKGSFTKESWGAGYSYNSAANTGQFVFTIGTGIGSTREHIGHASVISLASHTNNWYHVGVTFDDSDKSYRIRVYDNNLGAILGVDKTGNTAANWAPRENAVSSVGLNVAGFVNVDHNIDEIVIFNDILSQAEIDEIRGGTFGGGAAGGGVAIIGSDF